MADTWIIPGGPTLQENEDGAVWLVPGVAVVQEAEAAAGEVAPTGNLYGPLWGPLAGVI